ncbi:MAG: M20 family metallopeptidase, partial [Acidimicrobiia bacterium]
PNPGDAETAAAWKSRPMTVASEHPSSEQLATWVSKLVQIPSVNPLQAGPRAGEPGETRLAEMLAEQFRHLGADFVETVEVIDGRPNVYGIWEGTTDRWCVLDVHTDTVTVEHCEGDPFDGRIADGRVYGRGAVDTKASMGVMLAVLEAARAEGRRLEPNLLVVGSISEEAGGLLGAVGFREWATARGLAPDEVIVAEPTMCAPIHGHKGGVALDIVVQGLAAHSAQPHLGRNAVVAAAKLIMALDAEHHRLQALTPTTAVGNGTLTVSVINGGTGGNVVPDSCTVTVGRRIVPGEDNEEVANQLIELVERACPLPVEITRAYMGSPAFYQPPESPFVQKLASWAGTSPEVAPYGTNALRYDGFAKQMVVFGPGSIDNAHTAVEYVELSQLELCASVYRRWLGLAAS